MFAVSTNAPPGLSASNPLMCSGFEAGNTGNVVFNLSRLRVVLIREIRVAHWS
jgi:hypothetical protein